MNEYGRQAMNHWQQWFPQEYQQIEDPKAHFAALGEQAADQILQIEDEIVRSGTPSEEYLDEVGRRNMARMTAREIVMSELLPAPPDEEEPDDPEAIADRERLAQVMDEEGMPLDRSHPLWHDLESDEVSPQAFRDRYREWYRSALNP